MKKKIVQRDESSQDVADALGIDEKTVRRWCAKKIRPCPNTRKLNGAISLNSTEVAAWMKANNVTGKPGRPDGPPTEQKSHKTRQIAAMADFWELRVSQQKGKLMDADAVENEFASLGVLMRNGFQNLASQIVPLALSNGMPHEAAAEFGVQIEEMVNGILRQLSTRDTQVDAEGDN